jgi:formylglycine-generating enzyme required for sulfatase activity
LITSQIIIKKPGKMDEHFSSSEFPVSLGTSEDCNLQIPGPGNDVFAVIGVLDCELFIERKESAAPIYVNGKNLINKLILNNEDSLRCFGTEITLQCKNEEFTLVVNTKNSDYLTQPPVFIKNEGDNFTEEIEAKKFTRNIINRSNLDKQTNNKWKILVTFLMFILILISYLIFSSYSVKFKINPSDTDSLSIQGSWFKFPIGDRVLLRKGTHSLLIEREGYYPANKTFVVEGSNDQIVSVDMKKLPGIVNIYTNSNNSNQVSLDGSMEIGVSIEPKVMQTGQYVLTVNADRFLPFAGKIEVKGMNITQHIFVDLIPGWANINIDSVPSDAIIYNRDVEIGRTPANLELMEGIHDISIIKEGYQAWDGRYSVKANTNQVIETIKLQPANAKLNVKTIPFGANIKVNGRYRGQSPLVLSLSPNEEYVIAFSKSGFDASERKIRLDSAQEQSIEVDLAARLGKVIISVKPIDAEIFIDKKKEGKGRLEIDLSTMNHELLVKKEGYAPFFRKILPRLNYPQNIDVTLLTEEEVRLKSIQSRVTNSQGQILRRIEAGKFVMGASRREMGRRANEVIQNVELTKPFYIGTKEVTNKEFSRFRGLNSAVADIHPSLLADNNPVILVSWSDAIEYCNWLSNKEGLEPVYIKRFEKWERKKPTQNGYRLPTEAEWSWSIRYQTKNTTTTFPWGNRLPPRRDYGNFADSSAKNLIPNIISNYEDGYASTSPVGSFRANSLGIFDGSGNVSEWISDYYSIPTPGLTEVATDPNGPEFGIQHVIRGSSWRHASVTQLRGSFRDFGSKGQVDIGFRLARNIN